MADIPSIPVESQNRDGSGLSSVRWLDEESAERLAIWSGQGKLLVVLDSELSWTWYLRASAWRQIPRVYQFAVWSLSMCAT
jgi:hypothetical protein